MSAVDLPDDPYDAFHAWFAEADRLIDQAEAAALATADASGMPSVRIVLHKGISDGGFTFYTNYASRKAADLNGNAASSLLFFWQPLKRQVRLEGTVERLTKAESAAYFATRDRDSQLGAWASDQSRPIASRAALLARVEELRERFAGEDVPCPEGWGGYRLRPTRFEFWQGQANRLHDRLVYEFDDDRWRRIVLAP
jgi:pyridoxamine 5'-phosphate oxidase